MELPRRRCGNPLAIDVTLEGERPSGDGFRGQAA
jgi:hypothetical protein